MKTLNNMNILISTDIFSTDIFVSRCVKVLTVCGWFSSKLSAGGSISLQHRMSNKTLERSVETKIMIYFIAFTISSAIHQNSRMAKNIRPLDILKCMKCLISIII